MKEKSPARPHYQVYEIGRGKPKYEELELRVDPPDPKPTIKERIKRELRRKKG